MKQVKVVFTYNQEMKIHSGIQWVIEAGGGHGSGQVKVRSEGHPVFPPSVNSLLQQIESIYMSDFLPEFHLYMIYFIYLYFIYLHWARESIKLGKQKTCILVLGQIMWENRTFLCSHIYFTKFYVQSHVLERNQTLKKSSDNARKAIKNNNPWERTIMKMKYHLFST